MPYVGAESIANDTAVSPVATVPVGDGVCVAVNDDVAVTKPSTSEYDVVPPVIARVEKVLFLLLPIVALFDMATPSRTEVVVPHDSPVHCSTAPYWRAVAEA